MLILRPKFDARSLSRDVSAEYIEHVTDIFRYEEVKRAAGVVPSTPFATAYAHALAETTHGSRIILPLFGDGWIVQSPGPALDLLTLFVKGRCESKMIRDDARVRFGPITWTLTETD